MFHSQVKEAMQRIHDRGNIGKLILDVEKSPTPLVTAAILIIRPTVYFQMLFVKLSQVFSRGRCKLQQVSASTQRRRALKKTLNVFGFLIYNKTATSYSNWSADTMADYVSVNEKTKWNLLKKF